MSRQEVCAERILQRLNACGLSQAQLALKSGLSRGSVSHYIAGRNTPNNVSAAKLAKVLGVDPVWLLGYDVPCKTVLAPKELDSETAQKALELYQDPSAKILLDAKRVLSEEDLQAVVTLINSLAARRK